MDEDKVHTIFWVDRLKKEMEETENLEMVSMANCYVEKENIFLKFINDSRKHVGLNPLPRAHYYPAQPDHLQPRQLEDFQRRFGRPGYKLQMVIHRILVTRRKYMITRKR